MCQTNLKKYLGHNYKFSGLETYQLKDFVENSAPSKS